MYVSPAIANTYVHAAVQAALASGDLRFAGLDDIPAPIYVADADGFITFYNKACVEFAGRVPIIGKDQWCVTWKLYTNDGDFIPHADCPMAVAIQTQQPIRNVTAVAERPNGTRVNFMPYPTPLFTDEGRFVGAVNLLVDMTDGQNNAADFSAASNVVPFHEPRSALTEDSLRLMVSFVTVRSRSDRLRIIEMVEAFIRRLHIKD